MKTASVLLLSAAAAAAAWYTVTPFSATPARLRIERTAARVDRGRYLFAVAACDSCHSPRDFSRFAGPAVNPGSTEPPHAPNLTADPATGLGNWTDAEIVRAVREGIGRDGQALDPAMPYRLYRRMSDDDVFAITAYIRTLSPVTCPLQHAASGVAGWLWRRTEVKAVRHVPPVDPRDSVRYGEYLATIGRCADCHTRADDGARCAGGRLFRLPGAAVASSNLTPAPRAGIGGWSEQDFIDRFHQYRGYADKGSPAVGPEGFTVMPWLSLCRMTPDDLRAIYSWLRTLPPVPNEVATHPISDKATLMSLRKNF